MTTLSPVWTRMPRTFSMLQTVSELPRRSRMTSYSICLNDPDVPLEQDLPDRARPQAAPGDLLEVLGVVRHPAALPAEGEGDPDHHREAELGGRLLGLLERVDGLARQRRDVGAGHQLDELGPVLRRLDAGERRTEDLDLP